MSNKANKENKLDWKGVLVLFILLVSVILMLGGIYMGVRNFFIPSGHGFESVVLFSLGLNLILMFTVINMLIQAEESQVKKENKLHSGRINFVTFDENGKQINSERKAFDSVEDLGQFRKEQLLKHLEAHDMGFKISPEDMLKEMSVKELESARQVALENDDYEWAAVIRDEIKSRKK